MATDRDLVSQLGSVGRAFFGRFDSLREVQRQAIGPIYAGQSVLVSSATASGKTEAILAPLIARIRAQSSNVSQDVLVLAVAPTRALVNDLYARLCDPLREIGWSCGRQTSDHREKTQRPQLLITTPESFDSMLVRDSQWEDGNLAGHLLSRIEAVFVDEAHLFESSPRGDQLVWLIGRLRRLRAHAHQKGWAPSESIQRCAASATVSNPAALATRILGEGSTALCVQGSREVEVLGTAPLDGWVPLEHLPDPQAIFRNLLFSAGPDDLATVVSHVWRAVEEPSAAGCRKVLVFVPSRALCDRLSLALSDFFKTRREMFVGAHHGSLERAIRESAETEFASSRDAVLVATTTLEVGIDIGDVDVVAVVGAPPDTSSLLQRIGRSGRRSGRVRVLPIVRNAVEGRAFASMLDAACRGTLDAAPQTRLWSVFVQQAASYTIQGRKRGRRRSDLLALAQMVWPEQDAATANRILVELVEQGVLLESGDRLFLGSEWSDRFERAGGGFHNNFDAGGSGIPVVDGSTGEVITHVLHSQAGGASVALAGRRWNVVSQAGEIVVASAAQATGDVPFRYAARSAPTGRSYAEHVRRGFGFASEAAPVLQGPSDDIWFHFGGSAFEAVLRVLIPGLRSVKGLAGLALGGTPSESALHALAEDTDRLGDLLRGLADDVAAPMTLGRYHGQLPLDVRTAVCVQLLDPDGFARWLASRDLRTSELTQLAEGRLRGGTRSDGKLVRLRLNGEDKARNAIKAFAHLAPACLCESCVDLRFDFRRSRVRCPGLGGHPKPAISRHRKTGH